jgi:hypothetical protein
MRFVLGLSLLLMAACSEDKIRLNGEEIAALFVEDRKLAFQSIRYTGWVNVFANKKAAIAVIGLGQDEGEWWIDGDTMCTKWKELRQGATLCAYIARYVEGGYAVENIATGVNYGEIFFEE